ncbi:MAG: DEAD/DEAH box helicase [Candidatus Riflebacteria bacterium]|nr:DEAD/DEAH box helicase [Candidatus Riflebacteria bacterium]
MNLDISYRNFKLDPFQIQAITEIENGHSLVLAAPTGSGKTLVAEYLIEKVLKTNQRIIYTSPIKALSNQKFRDFSALYGDRIGILTGDVVINRDAQALIVTTEVYRNMAIEDPEALHDIAYVIFDEIHYLGDIERGTVWEESIIFSPKNVRFLALSATIPNADEFARWIETNADQLVKVIVSEKRAVPLTYLFFHDKVMMNFKDLSRRVGRKSASDDVPEVRRTRGPRGEKEADQRHLIILKTLHLQDRLPLLYFAFSRAVVDDMAWQAAKQFDFTTSEEKRNIDAAFAACLEKYKIGDLESAHILGDQLRRGVGRHHAGLLPQLKELVEILFAERLLRVLYVTETFAMGVNMPARTVAFDALKKYDGRSFRSLKTLEFRQISGRAGRRGIDEMGWVVIPWLPRDTELEDLERIVYGDVEPLLSQFDLSFNSVLNLYAGHENEEIRTILKRNFAQFQANKNLPLLAEKVTEHRLMVESAMPRCTEKKDDLPAFGEFFKRKQEIIDTMQKQMSGIQHGMRGRQNRVHKLRLQQQFGARIKELDEEELQFICGTCHNKNRCTGKLFRAMKIQKKLDYWRERLEMQEQLQLPLYEEKVAVLKRLGYIDEKGLLARGEFASRIHIEEIAVTELYFKGYFHEWDHHEINALAVALVYEFRKRGVEVEKPARCRGLDRMREAKAFIMELSRQYKFINPLDISFSMLIYSWSTGAPFDEISRRTNMSEGDLIRLFRQAIDLIRQIRDATDDQSLRDKFLECLDYINRDIVLATELRD